MKSNNGYKKERTKSRQQVHPKKIEITKQQQQQTNKGKVHVYSTVRTFSTELIDDQDNVFVIFLILLVWGRTRKGKENF